MPPLDNLSMTDTIWASGTAAANITISASGSGAYQPSPPTPEQQAARRRIEEERQAAREKAKELLVAHLTPEQRAEYEQEGHFHIETAEGRRRYRLRPGSPPVRVQGEDGRRWSYCIHPRDQSFPAEDVTLALKLMLETEEEAFLRTANASAAYA